MKILHTADWHLGNNFHGHDRLEEHRHFLQWLITLLKTEKPDALIIAGDLFDSANPSAAAEELLYTFFMEATEAVEGLQIVSIAGNHDSAGRIDAPAALLKCHNIYVRGTVQWDEAHDGPDFDNLILPLGNRESNEAEVVCLAIPYLRPYDYPSGMTVAEGLQYYFEQLQHRIQQSDFKQLPVIAVAHFYAAGAEICTAEHSERLVVGGQDCVPTDIVGKGICYTALGHIHRAQQLKSDYTALYYAGSALPMSFTEKHYQHGVFVVDIAPDGEVKVDRKVYAPLRNLMTLPQQGTATAEDILREIQLLPIREKGDTGTTWPYLEIRLLEDRPQPTLLHEVTEALADKAVHFCRMVRELPEATADDTAPQQRETLHALSPLDMAQRVYQKRYQTEMPEELKSRFLQAQELSLKAQN